MASPVGNCPKCGAVITDQHPYSLCPKCGEPLPPELAVRVPHVQSPREAAQQATVPASGPPPVPPHLVSIPSLIVTTGNKVRGRPIEGYLGVARGIVVRSPNIAQGMMGGLKQLVGGNIESYATVCEESRRQAFDRMVKHATAMGADAVVAMRYDATEFSPGVTEVLAYGTAVKLGAPIAK